MRVGIGYLLQETNSFSPLKAKLADFHPVAGNECIGRWAGSETEIGGFLDVLRASPHEAVPLFAGWAITEGPIEAAEFTRLRAWVGEQLRAAGKLGALVIALHGGMCAEGTDDCEGVLLADIRAVSGRDVPLVLTLDLHANITARMVASVNAVIGYRTYPRVDMYETGCCAAELLLKMLRGEIHPVTAMRKLPLIVPAENMMTTVGPLAAVLQTGKELQSSDTRLLSISAFGVQPWLDVQEIGCATVTVTDRDLRRAEYAADCVARAFRDRRREFDVELLDPAEAVAAALQVRGQPVVLAESSDSPTAGSPGDSADMLAALRQNASETTAALWVRDERVVEQVWHCRPGDRVSGALGGLHDPANRQPVPFRGALRSLSDGRFHFSGGYNRGMPLEMGRTAVIDDGPVTVVVSEAPVANIAPEIFRSQGVEPRERKLVVVKSAAGFGSEYGPFAAAILMVDTPGISSANLRRPYRRVPRPIYPLDDAIAAFIPTEIK
jgi:microcystin degradation protein MlrC